MRIDKFLKLSRIIKRRTVARAACQSGRVKVNDHVAKPGREVEVGDRVEIEFGNRILEIEVVEIATHVPAAKAPELYRVIREEYREDEA
ncbi:MAG: RNA-binding S4 domain-containing protein [Bacillota bacterium]